MPKFTKVQILFQGEASRVAPVTWGQRPHAQKSLSKHPDEYNSNLGLVIPLDSRPTTLQIVAVIQHLILTHESLRTVFRRQETGEIQQIVLSGGIISLEILELSAEEESKTQAYTALSQMMAQDFDVTKDIGLRSTIITRGSVPHSLALCLPHTAVDFWALRSIERELKMALVGDSDCSSPVVDDFNQPVDRAYYEASQAGRNVEARALAYLGGALQAVPQSMFATLPFEEDRAANRGQLESKAVTIAANSVAQGLGVSTTTVYYAAVSVLLAWRNSTERCHLPVVFANRIRRTERAYIGTSSADVDLVVDAASGSFCDLVRRINAATHLAYAHCSYDVTAYVALAEEIGRRRGISIDRWLLVNDLRVFGSNKCNQPDTEDLRDEQSRSHFSFIDARPLRALRVRDQSPRKHPKFYFSIYEKKDAATVLDVQCAAAALSPKDLRSFLYGIEQIIVEAFYGDFDLHAIGNFLELQKYPRGRDWTLVNGSWVHIPSTIEMLRALGICDDPHILVADRGDQGEGIVACINEGPEFFDLYSVHERVIRALSNFGPVVAPKQYLVAAERPTNPLCLSAWRQVAHTIYLPE